MKDYIKASEVTKLLGQSTKALRKVCCGMKQKDHGPTYFSYQEVKTLVEEFAPGKLPEVDIMFEDNESAIQLYECEPGLSLRTFRKDDQVWVVAADACELLGLKNPTETLKQLDPDEKAKFNLGLSGGITNCVTDIGLYALCLMSRKPYARERRRWLLHEVLPKIMTDGYYIDPAKTQVPDTFAQKLAEARQILDIAKSLTPEEISVLEMTGTMEEKILAAAKLSKHSDITL